ncbi:MAG TPA: FecR domain-containing protein [Bacteroidales bacterium]|nr:FecR domain-containing protein [Bacteroidales bacterium]
MKPFQNTGDTNTEDFSPDTGQAWKKLYTRLQQDQLIPDTIPDRRHQMTPLALMAAAAVLVLAVITPFVYRSYLRQPAARMIRIDTQNETATLIRPLTDGSLIYIARNSVFSYPVSFDRKTRKVELNGEAFFDIAPDPAKPFIIETGTAILRVLGTAFDLQSTHEGSFQLSVERGKVEVTLKADPSRHTIAMAGEIISTLGNRLVRSKQVATGQNSWYREHMHFKDENLENIILVLNRNFNTNFALADDKTGKHKLTVTFQRETAETMAGLICTTLNLKSQTINGAVVFSEKK